MNVERIRKFVRLLSSPQDREVVAAARALLRSLAADGEDIHALADAIGQGSEISEDEMKRIYDAGFDHGVASVEHEQPVRFDDVTPWRTMAAECLRVDDKNGWLAPHERGFCEDMVRWCERREPTEKQGRWLHLLWMRAKKRSRK
jgi:hypothetical protein